MEELSSGGIKIHQIENSKEFKKIIKKMGCCICLHVVCKPVECLICQTLICEDCFQILTIAGKKCMTPHCKGDLRKANKFVREILSNLKIKCDYCEIKGVSYHDYISHIEKCENYQSSERVKLLRAIKNEDERINEMTKKVEDLRFSNSKIIPKIDPYAHLNSEALRHKLLSFSLPNENKMKLYTSCIEGNLETFKSLVEDYNYSVLEEISAHNYYWTPLHYAMHYGQWRIIEFICENLRKNNKLEAAFRLESNDKRCPLLCLLRSNSIDNNKKNDILTKLLKIYPYIKITEEVKIEIKNRKLNVLSVISK